MMYQQEIQFFWPLTEQIPLALDYSDCERPKYYSNNTITGTFDPTNGTTGITLLPYNNVPSSWSTSINVDTNNITIISKNLPPLYRRILYKLLGINWKQK
jgi:hypothetical protein